MSFEKQSFIIGRIFQELGKVEGNKAFPEMLPYEVLLDRAKELFPALATEKQAWALVTFLNQTAVGVFDRAYVEIFNRLEACIAFGGYDSQLNVAMGLNNQANMCSYNWGERAIFARDAYLKAAQVHGSWQKRVERLREKVDSPVGIYQELASKLRALGFHNEFEEEDLAKLDVARDRLDPSLAWDVVNSLNTQAIDFLLRGYIPPKLQWLSENMLPGDYARFDQFVVRKIAKADTAIIKLGTRVLAAMDAVDEINHEVATVEKRLAKKATRQSREAQRRSRQLERAAHSLSMKGRGH